MRIKIESVSFEFHCMWIKIILAIGIYNREYSFNFFFFGGGGFTQYFPAGKTINNSLSQKIQINFRQGQNLFQYKHPIFNPRLTKGGGEEVGCNPSMVYPFTVTVFPGRSKTLKEVSQGI